MHGPTLTLVFAIWFALVAASAAYVAWDIRSARLTIATGWAWIIVTAFTGPVAWLLYMLSRRARSRVDVLSAAVRATVHCVAGDATGIVAAAAVTRFVHFGMLTDALVEYAAGLAVGLFVFQAAVSKRAHGGGYGAAIRRMAFTEWVSMNAVMTGMIPVMVALMRYDARAMDPTSICFWGMMSLGTVAGLLVALPVNVCAARTNACKSAVAIITTAMVSATFALAWLADVPMHKA